MLSISQEQGRSEPHAKGQAGLEMMAFFAFALLIFSVVYVLITSRTITAFDSKVQQEALEIAERAASEINTAVAEGQGYSKSFMLPDSIRGREYNVTVEKGFVFVDWRNGGVASYTIVENITGNFAYGWNTVENKEGIIVVSQTAA